MGSVLCLFGLVTVHEHTHNCTHIHSCAHGDCTKVVFVNQFCYDMIQKHFFVCFLVVIVIVVFINRICKH